MVTELFLFRNCGWIRNDYNLMKEYCFDEDNYFVICSDDENMIHIFNNMLLDVCMLLLE